MGRQWLKSYTPLLNKRENIKVFINRVNIDFNIYLSHLDKEAGSFNNRILIIKNIDSTDDVLINKLTVLYLKLTI